MENDPEMQRRSSILVRSQPSGNEIRRISGCISWIRFSHAKDTSDNRYASLQSCSGFVVIHGVIQCIVVINKPIRLIATNLGIVLIK